MQPPGPPRPFQGARYDKDMFTFLPAGLNKDVLPESSRKRKSTSPDYQMNVPPNVRHENSDHQLNSSNLQDKRTSNSTLAFNSSASSSFRAFPDQSQSFHPNAERQDHNKKGLYESGSDYIPFSVQLQSPNHKVSSSSYPIPEVGTIKNLSLLPQVINDFKQYDRLQPNSRVATHMRPYGAPPNISQCDRHDSNAQVATHKSLQPPVTKGSYQHEKRESNVVKVVSTSSYIPPSTTKDSFRPEKLDSNTLVMTHKTSNVPPSVTQVVNQNEKLGLNAHVAGVEKSSHLQERGGNQMPVEPKTIVSDLYERASNILAEYIKLPQNVLNPRAFSSGLGEKGLHEEATYKVDCPSNAGRIEIGSSSGRNSDKTPGNTTSASVYDLQTETNNLLHVLRLLSAASGISIPENHDGKIQGSGLDVKMMKSTTDSNIHLNQHPQAESTLSKKLEEGHYAGILAENVGKGSTKLDGECKLDGGASALDEKLWDGTLKLSTSVSVSAIAFFKSGEKMQDFSWSNVEVKGKVRLEAFDKYVHDLLHSRSRGLMVMSLCCKDGSSDAGHESMKEVAKKYKDQRKVGFAKPSSNIDLYICPHSDAIITIITKHGFCKGLTYIEDQNVPLIGCVVWKKNSSSSHSNHPEVQTSAKQQTPTRDVATNRSEKIPEFKTDVEDNKSVISVPSVALKIPEFKTDVEDNNPVLLVPSVASKTSVDVSADSDDEDDEDDLPEYDFRAALSRASVTVSITSEIEAPKPNPEGPANKNVEQKPEVQEQKPVEKGTESLKTRNLFDDGDDMPEWFPPDFVKRENKTIRAESSYSLSNSNVSTTEFADLASGVLPPPPPPPPPLSQMQLQGQNHPSAPWVLPRPTSVTQMQVHGASNPSVHFPKPSAIGIKPETSASISTQLPSYDGKYPSAPHFQPPPPPVSLIQVHGASNPFLHLPKAPSTGFNPEISASKSTQLPSKDGKYPSAPHVPPLSAANNFVHQNPVAISPQMQFKEQKYTSAPHVSLPPVNIPGANNNFMHQSSAAQSNQKHTGGKLYSCSPRPPLTSADKSLSGGIISSPVFRPGFSQNPGFRPCFDPPGTKNGIRPSTWRRKP